MQSNYNQLWKDNKNIPKYTEVKQSTSKWSIGHKEFSKEIRKNSELRDN